IFYSCSVDYTLSLGTACTRLTLEIIHDACSAPANSAPAYPFSAFTSPSLVSCTCEEDFPSGVGKQR
ncbi:hypothetical protein PIB30_094447, partial [Stylosanthes scabra]|nr:hypothetical protein [Stylosanthes scabra]